ncbi:MAG: hypothetical protein ACK4EX_11355 [Thermaurantimonas sp.]|uniref:hypothetical protein n=1 Tax=Thermaurantimonas sp. TaxID=2681568 RepID=UPI00391B12A3
MDLTNYLKKVLYGLFKGIQSALFFYLVLAFNIVLLFTIKFFPSMDGPAHLYNANMIAHLLKGNESLSEFFMIKKFWIPNWTSHAFLAVLHFVMPAWLAEKTLIILYVSGMAFSFRFLVKQMNSDSVALSVLIFPFMYSFLFHLGFYNFSLSFIFFFYAVGLWIRRYSSGAISG